MPPLSHGRLRQSLWLLLCGCIIGTLLHPVTGLANSPKVPLSRLVEAAGQVESSRQSSSTWRRASAGDLLYHLDRLRTGKKSRAALQLSDLSVIRLNQQTTIQIQAPNEARATRIFDLKRGSLYFFNREKPADIEFRTPLSSGSIRGTEFVIEVDEDTGTSHLTMLDGEVLLKGPQDEISVRSGEQAEIRQGEKIKTSKVIETMNRIQWSLYYPTILDPLELALTQAERDLLRETLSIYASGDYLQALASMPETPDPQSPALRLFSAGLVLGVGQVQTCIDQLETIRQDSPLKAALNELIAAVQFRALEALPQPDTASQWLARSYYLQSRADLKAAREAAREAVRISPAFGPARTRLAELEFSMGRNRQAMEALKVARQHSPKDPRSASLQGFIWLDQNRIARAKIEFESATQLDAAMAEAWLGLGMCYLLKDQRAEGRRLLQIAAALEPHRSLLRSYLAKAFAANNEPAAAHKDFRRAKDLDPGDPTPWLYSALFLQQQNRLNEAMRALERSRELNDNQSLFRSRLRLDQDRSTRTANLAVLYEETGLDEVAEREAARSVALDYGNFATHHFLANSMANRSSPYRIEQRYETVRESERLMANLMAPIGGENLSTQISTQERLRYFSHKPIRSTAFSSYRSNGDWSYGGSVFGTFTEQQLSYALDLWQHDWNGWRPNSDLKETGFSLQLKHQLGLQDGLFLQVSQRDFEAGDLARYYSDSQAKQAYRIVEKGDPDVLAGIHHRWQPEHHTLFLAGRLDHDLQVRDGDPNVLFVRKNQQGVITGIETPPLFDLNYESQYELYSLEAQHIWQTDRHAVIVGSRYQTGALDTHAVLNRQLSGTVTDQTVQPDMQRFDAYAYYQWQLLDSLKWITGLSYEHLKYPVNTDFLPVSEADASRSLVGPKVGLIYQPQEHTQIRAAYSRSLGGLFFDNSVRLQPTQLAGFNQAFRSLAPESVVGQTAGSRFETFGLGLDRRWKTGTYFGIAAEWLRSEGRREIGALTHTGALPIPEEPTFLVESMDYSETALSLNLQQLCGDLLVLGGRYRGSYATLNAGFPSLDQSVNGAATLNRSPEAWLHHVNLFAIINHPSGFYGRMESNWYRQDPEGHAPGQPVDTFFQHNLLLGYHFPRRSAELQIGILNVFDQSYNLHPLNLHPRLPQERTFTVQFRIRY